MDLISKKGQFSFPSQVEGIFPGKKLNPDFDLRIETLNLDFIFFVHYFKGFSLSKMPTTTNVSTKKYLFLLLNIKIGKNKMLQTILQSNGFFQ